MSDSSADFERLLREAIRRTIDAAPRASDDLVRYSSRAAEAVDKVTQGVAALELVPIQQPGDSTPTYQLLFRKVGSKSPPSDLGIFRLSAAGYPVHRWYSVRKWQEQPEQPDRLFETPEALQDPFKWLISEPDSRLVILVAYFQQQATAAGAAG